MEELCILVFACVVGAAIFGGIFVINIIYRRERRVMTSDQRKADDLADRTEAQQWQP